ncbi:hypothetical protein AALA61_15950 [Oscillospiraceae bacterium 42-9]
MKRYEGYQPVKSTHREILPPGGYVVKIMKVEDAAFANGPCLVVSFDIAEGEKAGFYTADYRGNTFENKKWRGVHFLNRPAGDGSERDGWAVHAMNNFVAVLQESNPGYTWDWGPIEAGDYSQLKGKLLGALMGRVEWEYEGKTGWNTKCRAFLPAQDIRAGDFQIPEDKPLSKKTSAQPVDIAGFDSDNDLPF